MLAAIKSFFSDWFGSGGAADNDFSGGGGGGGRGFGGVHGFSGFSAEYGSGDFWATGSRAPGASRELLVAEAAYEQRLQNTMDARDARSALQRGDTGAAISILNRNPEVGVSIGGVELYGTTGAAFLQTQGEAARVAAQQGIDRTGQVRANLNGQTDDTSATNTNTSSSAPGFDGGVINIPVGASDTQWEVVKRSLAAFAKKADLPVEEQANFINYWTARLAANGETSLYNYTTNGRQKITAEEFADYQRRGAFPSYLTPDRQPVIVADLQRRLAEIEGEVVRISVNDAQQRAAEQQREGFGSFMEGFWGGDFSGNDSWSAATGQIVGGLIPGYGQLADARDTAAAVRGLWRGEEGAGVGLVGAAVGWVPIVGDSAKTAIKAGRKMLQESAEEVAERAAKEAAQQATLQAMKAVPEDVVVNALKEGFMTRRMQFGEHAFQLDHPGMKHILQRHHPEYWDGSIKTTQTFLDSKMSIEEVGDAVHEIMKQNRETFVEKGTSRTYSVTGEYNGQEYVLGVKNGRVGQFYPKP